jgi:hypothetical protein
MAGMTGSGHFLLTSPMEWPQRKLYKSAAWDADGDDHGDGGLHVARTSAGEESGYLPAPNGTGHLVYLDKGTLFAVPFDPEKLEVRGTPSPVVEGVAYTGTRSAQFDLSQNGTLVYFCVARELIAFPEDVQDNFVRLPFASNPSPIELHR